MAATKMKRTTAIRQLTKRANTFLGMTLDDYLIKFTYEREGTYRFNENGFMQEVWYRLGCPTTAEEAHASLPRLDDPYRYRQVAE
jgi:hypothetical protein